MDNPDIYQQQGFGRRLEISGRIALVIVDFVEGFADPAVFGGGNIREAIQNTMPVLEEARRRNWPVAFTRIVFAEDGSDANVFSMKVPGLLKLTETARISAVVPELRPIPGELILRKTVPSGFCGTGLAAWLTQRAVETVVIAGAVTSGCVRATVVDAMSLGFRPIVLEDCTGDRALGPHEANLFDMAQKYADVMPFAEVLTQLASTPYQTQRG